MPCAQPRSHRLAPLLALAATLGSAPAFASPALATPDQGSAPSASTPSTSASNTPTAPTLRLEAAGGPGWARDSQNPTSRSVSGAHGELSYVGTEGAVFGLHGLYEDSMRSYLPTSPTAAGVPPVTERERRVDIGVRVGWDPLHSWAVPRSHRAGFVLTVMALDIDQFMNRFAPVVGFEPGGGGRAYVHLVGPVLLNAGGTYQWATNFSQRAATARAVRGRPLGTWRYDARLGVELSRFVIDARYAGESFDFEHERTQMHSLLLGVSFDV